MLRKVQTSEVTHTNTTHVHQQRTQKRKIGSDTKINLLIRLEEILSAPPTLIKGPTFRFGLSDTVAVINYEILQGGNFDLQKSLMDHPLEPTSIGYEFRLIDQLKRILGNHPNWKLIQATICDVTKYHTTPIEEKILITDLRHQLLKSNHNSASGERATILSTKLAKEV